MTKVNEKTGYEKPAIVHRQVMESVAGACSVQDPTNGKTGSGDTCTVTSS